jgi:hypothetical protein
MGACQGTSWLIHADDYCQVDKFKYVYAGCDCDSGDRDMEAIVISGGESSRQVDIEQEGHYYCRWDRVTLLGSEISMCLRSGYVTMISTTGPVNV